MLKILKLLNSICFPPKCAYHLYSIDKNIKKPCLCAIRQLQGFTGTFKRIYKSPQLCSHLTTMRGQIIYFRRVKLNKPNCSSLKTALFIMSHHLLPILVAFNIAEFSENVNYNLTSMYPLPPRIQ